MSPSDATASEMWGKSDNGATNPQELNRYTYVNNNPIRWTDPTGHQIYTKEEAERVGHILSTKYIWDVEQGMSSDEVFADIFSDILSALEGCGILCTGGLSFMTKLAANVKQERNSQTLSLIRIMGEELTTFGRSESSGDNDTIQIFFERHRQYGCHSISCPKVTYNLKVEWSSGEYSQAFRGVSQDTYQWFVDSGHAHRDVLYRYFPGYRGGYTEVIKTRVGVG